MASDPVEFSSADDTWIGVYRKTRDAYKAARGAHPGAVSSVGGQLPLTASTDGILMLSTVSGEIATKLLETSRHVGDFMHNALDTDRGGADVGAVTAAQYLAAMPPGASDPTLRRITTELQGVELEPTSDVDDFAAMLANARNFAAELEAGVREFDFRPDFNSSIDRAMMGTVMGAFDRLARISVNTLASNRDLVTAGGIISTAECIELWSAFFGLCNAMDTASGRRATSAPARIGQRTVENAKEAWREAPAVASKIAEGTAQVVNKAAEIAGGAAGGFVSGIGASGAILIAVAVWYGMRP